MTTLDINGQKVQVDDSFLSLTPEQQEAEVNHIAQQMSEPKEDKLPLAPSAGVIGAATGPLTGKAVTPAVDRAAEFVANKIAGTQPKPLLSNTPESVQNWLKTQTSNPFAGGRTQEEAYRKSEIAAGKPVQSRGSNIPIRKGNLGISNQLPEATPAQKVASNILSQERLKAPGLFGRVVGMGAAGSEFGKTAEEIEKGHYGHAGLSALGGLGALASQSTIKPVRRVGQALMVGVPAIQHLMGEDETPEGYAGGSSVRKAAKHIGGAGLAGLFLYPQLAEAKEEFQHGKIGEGLGSLANTAASFIPSGALGALLMGLSPSELGAGTLRGPDEAYQEGQTGLLKNSTLPPQGYAPGGSIKNLATRILKASEALAPHEGKVLNVTQSDRMRSTMGDLGGPGFSKFQLENPAYAGAAWGVGQKPTASAIVNVNKKYPEGKAIWTPMIGSETQHHSNQHVYDMLAEEFNRQAAMGKLTPELQARINTRLANAPATKGMFPEDFDIGNPEHLKQYGDTFNRRGAISTVMSGEGVGGTKGRIIDYPAIMQEMTDPMTIGAPTHSLGTRLFDLTGEIEHRPDLHSAFPYILKGEDKGVAFAPVPKELGLSDWITQFKEFKGRDPGYYDLVRTTPSQLISDKYLRKLEEAGHKKGGKVKKKK